MRGTKVACDFKSFLTRGFKCFMKATPRRTHPPHTVASSSKQRACCVARNSAEPVEKKEVESAHTIGRALRDCAAMGCSIHNYISPVNGKSCGCGSGKYRWKRQN